MPRFILVALVWISGQAWADQAACVSPIAYTPAPPSFSALLASSQQITRSYGPNEKNRGCIVDRADPYDPGYLIEHGAYRGLCVDASTVRPPLVLAEDGQSITIANFYHNGKYWTAVIPKDAVSRVMYQGVPFKMIAGVIKFAHGQFRYILNRPITLREQSGNKTEVVQLNDIIVSATVTKPKGVEYSVFRGKDFGIATRVMSSVARGVEEIAVDEDRIHQYEMNLSPKQKSDFLVSAITRAANSGYKEQYALLQKNCATVVFDSLDSAIPRPPGVQPFRGKWWRLSDEIERPALKALRQRGIAYQRVPDMNTEMSCAKPGASLAGAVVNRRTLGAAEGACAFNQTTPPRSVLAFTVPRSAIRK